MPFYENGDVRIYYEEAGSGFPLLVTPGGGLDSWMGNWLTSAPFNAMEEFKDGFRVITMDQRNAPSGRSTGPVPTSNAWDAYADDQLGVLDQLGVQEFAFMGLCIGGSFVMKVIERAPGRCLAGIVSQPIGHRPENPGVMYRSGLTGWAPVITKTRPDVSMWTILAFLDSLYKTNPDLVYSVSRDFIMGSRTPILVMPDDTPAHAYDAAIELAKLSPKAELTIYPWKDTQEHTQEAVKHIRSFLKAHLPVATK